MKNQYLSLVLLFLSVSVFSQDTKLYFDHDSYAISDSSGKLLANKLPDFETGDSILLIGYADTLGTNDYNMELSRKRAESIAKWLAGNKIKTPIIARWKGENEAVNPYIGRENRCVEIFILSKAFNFPKKEEQLFIINNSRDTVIYGKAGTLIKIPANSVISPKGPDHMKLKVALTEYNTPEEIVLNQLSTRTSDDVLETNGMINLKILQDSEICLISKTKPIRVGFPVHGEMIDDMKLFYGKANKQDEIIWEESADITVMNETGNFIFVEEMPIFDGGGIEVFQQYIMKSIKYPEFAIDSNICGRVVVGFVVDANGTLCNARILRGAHSVLNDEAIRAILSSPKWTPGKQGGRNTRVQFAMPIVFSVGENCNYNMDNLGRMGSFYSNVNDSNFYKSEVDEINYYVFDILSLGWINCDWNAFKNKPKVNMRVTSVATGEIETHIIFAKYNAVLRGYFNNGSYLFNQLPKNEDIIILGIRKSGEKIYLAYKKAQTTSAFMELNDFEEVSFESLNDKIFEIRGLGY